MNRRSFLKGLGAMGAVVAAAPLMKFLPKPIELPADDLLSGMVLTHDGTGNLYWSPPTGFMIDGVSLEKGDPIFWTQQTDSSKNGIYEITSVTSHNFKPTHRRKLEIVA